jgi:hypothetical protein
MDLRDRMGRYGLDWSGSGLGPVEGTCEHSNEPSGSTKCPEVVEQLSNWQPLEGGSARWS